MAIRRYEADLHIHTLLSACAEVEMTPTLIVETATKAGLDMIAIADHNSCENASAVIKAAAGSAVKVIAGLEAQSSEGVHLLCLFDELGQAVGMQEAVYRSLPQVPASRRIYGDQMIVDSRDEFVAYCEELLSLPTSMSIDEVCERAEEIGGLVIPSHIDRLETGLCGILGLIPEAPLFEAFEISSNLTEQAARKRYPAIGDSPLIRSSDAHWLGAIGSCRTALHLEHRSVSEIRLACRREGGRRVGDA